MWGWCFRAKRVWGNAFAAVVCSTPSKTARGHAASPAPPRTTAHRHIIHAYRVLLLPLTAPQIQLIRRSRALHGRHRRAADAVRHRRVARAEKRQHAAAELLRAPRHGRGAARLDVGLLLVCVCLCEAGERWNGLFGASEVAAQGGWRNSSSVAACAAARCARRALSFRHPSPARLCAIAHMSASLLASYWSSAAAVAAARAAGCGWPAYVLRESCCFFWRGGWTRRRRVDSLVVFDRELSA